MNLRLSILLASTAIAGVVLAACGEGQQGSQRQTDVVAVAASAPTPVPTQTAVPTAVVSASTPPTTQTATPSAVGPTSTPSPTQTAVPATATPTPSPFPTHTATPTAVAPTSTPSPTQTAAPTAVALTASPSPIPVAAPTQLPAPRAETFLDRVWETAVMLAGELSPRASATQQEHEAAVFLADLFEGLGYEAHLQEFDAPSTSMYYVTGLSLLTPGIIPPYEVKYTYLDDQYNTVFFTLPLDPASRTPGQTGSAVAGLLVHASKGTQEELDGLDLDGKIALMERGGLPLGAKVSLAAEAGAAAAVVFNDAAGDAYFWERIARDMPIPAVGITRNQGLALVEALSTGENIAAQVTRSYFDVWPSRNVIAELNNDIDGDRVLIMGAHFDTTPGSAGANDNGSGLAVVSVLAEELADDEMPFDLRLVLFGAEETGLNGSFHYVRELGPRDRARIMAMINIDSVGTGNLTVLGSERLSRIALESAKASDIEIVVEEYAETHASDHLPFLYGGIDAVSLSADDQIYINSPEDTLQRVRAELLAEAVAIVLGMVNRLAASPPR